MSALMFTRDERRMPFVPITVAAMEAIREATPKGRPYAVATYVALLELANDQRGDRVAITYAGLVEIIGAGRTSVKQAIDNLVAARVLEVREQTHGRGQIANEYVVVEPPTRQGDESGTPGRQATGGRSSGDRPASARPSQPSAAQARTPKEEGEEARDARSSIEHRLPDDLPEHLHDAAVNAGRVLHRTAKARGQTLVVMLEAVGRAVGQRPTKDHVAVAEAVEHWLCWGKGQRAPCADVVARFRNFLGDAPDVRLPDGSPLNAPATGGNVHPIAAARKPTHDQLLAELRASNPRLNPPAAQQIAERT